MGRKMLVTVFAILMCSYSDGRTINGHDDLDVPTKGNYQQRSLGMGLDDAKFQTKDEPPRINEQQTGDHQRDMENNRFVQLRLMNNDEPPKKKGLHKDELLNTVDQERDEPPRVIKEESNEPPRFMERNEPPRVTEGERDEPPRFMERNEPPRVTEGERDEPPSFMERNEPPRVMEEKGEEPPRVMEEERDEAPKLMEEKREEPPRFMERKEPPRVTEEKREEPPKVMEEERDEAPKLMVKDDEPPRVMEEGKDEQFREFEEKRHEPPRVMEQERDEPLKKREHEINEPPRMKEYEDDEPPRKMKYERNEPPTKREHETNMLSKRRDTTETASFETPRFARGHLQDEPPRYSNDIISKTTGNEAYLPPRNLRGSVDSMISTGIVGNIFDMDKEYSVYKPRFPTPDEQVQLSDVPPKYNDMPYEKQGLRINKRDADSRLLKRSSKNYEQVLENIEDKYQALDELDESMTEELDPSGDNMEQKDQCVQPKLRFCGEFVDYPISKAQMSMHSFYDGLVEAGMDLLTITSKGEIRSCQKELKKVFCRDRFPRCRKGHVYWHGLQDTCSKVIEKCPAKLQDELRNLNMCRKLNEGKSAVTTCVSPIRTTQSGACALSASDKVSPWDRHSAIEVNNLLQMQKELFFPSEACMKSLSSYLCYPGKTCSGLEDAVELASNYKARCKKVLSSCNRMMLSKGMKMFFDCR